MGSSVWTVAVHSVVHIIMIATLWLLVFINTWDKGSAVSCDYDGELLPNSENCRKYYKCSNGAPSDQSCPGSLIFDPKLRICNWPQSVTCVVDIKPKIPIRSKTVKNEPFLLDDADFDLFQSDDGPTAPTAKPTTERNKDKFASLFHVKERDFTKLRDRHRNLRNRMKERAEKEKAESAQKSSGSGSLGNRGSSLFRNREKSFDGIDESLHERVKFKSRGSSFKTDNQNEKVKTKSRRPPLKPIECRANNELHANPQSCRKYFKCDNGLPSLQSCPSNLIFDSSINVCNFPDATECEEDPDAVLPELGSSDRHPPTVRKTSSRFSNTDIDDETPFFAPEPPKPSPDQGTVPSQLEALERERFLTDEFPLFKKVKETVRTLDTDEVEEIIPKRKENPDNVKRVEFILSEENYEELFPRRHPSYTYTRFIQAIGIFPSVCSYVGREEESYAICRKTLATMFAHFTQETGGHNKGDKEFDEWRQGLAAVREQGCTDTSLGCDYNDYCDDKDSITNKWSCGTDRSGNYKKYYGRGAKQLSYNFNYGQFSQAMFGDGRLLLDNPDFVADTWLNMASATWFYATPQPPKPSMLHVIDGTWVPNREDRRNGIKPGFGATINIINGGLECNRPDGRESNQAKNRIAYYKQFAWYLYVDFEDEELGCANQQQFTAEGAGALPIYWDKDWAFPYSCKLVNYQTAHSALVPGEYIDCVEENFKVSVRKK